MGASTSKTDHTNQENYYELFQEFMTNHMEEQPKDAGSLPWTISFIELASLYSTFLMNYKNKGNITYKFHDHVYDMIRLYQKKNHESNIGIWGTTSYEIISAKDYFGLYISGLRLVSLPVKS